MKRILIILNCLFPVYMHLSGVDLKYCKLTLKGTEYLGNISITHNNMTCVDWDKLTQKETQEIFDEEFPDGSKVLAKNYCRNPTENPKGPWCYILQKKLTVDYCNVTFCQSPDCRLSGPGMEYTGPIEKSSSGKKCLKWKQKHKLKEKHEEIILHDTLFPDGSVENAASKCRNPDGNIAGPWCYVNGQSNSHHSKELCDIPFCDDLGLIMYSEGSLSGEYFFFSSINETQSLSIRFRLWNPADWMEGTLNLFLSVYDIAANRDDIKRWKSGIEFSISHQRLKIKHGSLVNDTYIEVPHNLSGAHWTALDIRWSNPDNETLLIQVFEKSSQEVLAKHLLYIPRTIFEIQTFHYFSTGGSAAFLNLPSKDEDCPVYTVTQKNFTIFWWIKKSTSLTKDIEFFIRAKNNAVIILRVAPMVETNQVQVTIGDKNKIRVFTNNKLNVSQQLAESSWSNVLDFWKWEFFKLKLFKDKLQLFWVQQSNSYLLIEATHQNIESLLWVAFGSETVSYWTIYCDPRGIADPPPGSPPECVTQESDIFNGTQAVTEAGRQCIPWTDTKSILKKYQNDELFAPYGGKIFCQNYCRNLDNDTKGAYCFVRDSTSQSGFSLEYCHPRSCRLGDCKIAGTANDYIGQLNITRSKRQCVPWTDVNDTEIDINNFPDPTLEDAGNFCRNPSKSPAGCWCYTNDERVPRDFCFIRDCDRLLECTTLVSGYIEGTFIYILPSWRKHGLQFWLKAWNPDIYEGLILSMFCLGRKKEYRLLIGAEEGEKLVLIYRYSDSETMLLQKTLPHLIPTGKWKGFWLRPGTGKIELGYHGMKNAFFEWTASEKKFVFEPMYINFGTMKNHWIGMNFHCTECLTTLTSVEDAHKIFPINLWRDEMLISNLYINLRGTGSALVNLLWTRGFRKLFAIKIMSSENNIVLIRYDHRKSQVIAAFSVSSSMTEREWSEYIISFTEDSLTVHKDGIHLMEWKSTFPLLFYWFTVTAEEGTVIWSANCPAEDIDGEPRDGNWGKWGPWTCSVTCGRGEGRLERKCNDPPPNVFGNDCKGSAVYESICNDFPCGKITPDTNNMIRQYLSSQHTSLQIDVSERVVLNCNPEAISSISKEVSEMNVTWTHNGFPYSKTKFHMDENYSLVIPRAHEKHNGIYLCLFYQEEGSVPQKVILEVVSLVVIKSKPTKKIRKGNSLTLKCNGLPLSYVYADLSLRWELNGTVWKDYGLGTLQTFTVDKLENISDSHAGIWTCVVIQEDFNFKWTTNWIFLKVKSAPSFWSHLMEDVATAPLFGKLGNERNAMILFFALVGALVSIIILAIALTIKWLKILPSQKKHKR